MRESGWRGGKNGWKWIKLDENWWKWVKVDERGLKWTKVDESVWKGVQVVESWWMWIRLMKIDENKWKCMKVDENGWTWNSTFLLEAISNRCVAGCGARNKKKICIVGLLLLLLLVAGALVVALLSADSGQVVLFVWKVLLTESLRSVQRQTPTYSSVSSFVSYTFTNIINSLIRWSCDVKAQRGWKPEWLLWQEFRWVQRGLRIKRQVNQQTNQRQDFKKTRHQTRFNRICNLICSRWVVARSREASQVHLRGQLQPSHHDDGLWRQDLCGRLWSVSGHKWRSH